MIITDSNSLISSTGPFTMKNDHSGAENPDLSSPACCCQLIMGAKGSAQEPGGGDHRSVLLLELYYLCPLGTAPHPGSMSRFPHSYGKLTLVDHFDNGSYVQPQEDSPRDGLLKADSYAVDQTLHSCSDDSNAFGNWVGFLLLQE